VERQTAARRQRGDILPPGRKPGPPAAIHDELPLRRAHRRQDDGDLPARKQIEPAFEISQIARPIDHRRDVLLAGDLADKLCIEIRRRLVAIAMPEAGLRPQSLPPAQIVDRLRIEHGRNQRLATPRRRRQLPVDRRRRRPGREHEIIELDHDPPDAADIGRQRRKRRQLPCHQRGEAGIVDWAPGSGDVAWIEPAIDNRRTDQKRLRLQPGDLERLDQTHLDIEQAACTGAVTGPGRVVAKHPIGVAPKRQRRQQPDDQHDRRREAGGEAIGCAGSGRGGGAHGAALADRPGAGEPA